MEKAKYFEFDIKKQTNSFFFHSLILKKKCQ